MPLGKGGMFTFHLLLYILTVPHHTLEAPNALCRDLDTACGMWYNKTAHLPGSETWHIQGVGFIQG